MTTNKDHVPTYRNGEYEHPKSTGPTGRFERLEASRPTLTRGLVGILTLLLVIGLLTLLGSVVQSWFVVMPYMSALEAGLFSFVFATMALFASWVVAFGAGGLIVAVIKKNW